MAKQHDQYGFLTKFFNMSDEEARARIDFMIDHLGIKDFQLYDAFFTYSQPMAYGMPLWETKASKLINDHQPQKRHIINIKTLRVCIDQIKKRGGRSWLYVQSIACDENENLPPCFRRIPFDHIVGSQPLFACYFPDEMWAQRMCDIWVPFALYLGVDGIHWDSLGTCGGVLHDGSIFSRFLRHSKTVLDKYKLLQTFNFVDGFGWDASLVHDSIIEFPYWEVWTLPRQEDTFFEEMRLLPENKKGVFVCYPYGSHNPLHIQPRELAIGRFNKCIEHGCKYLLFGDGDRMIKTEYFPNNESMFAIKNHM